MKSSSQKIVLLGTTTHAAIHFRGALIKMLVQLKHTVYVFCSDYTPETRLKIEELGGIPLDSPFQRLNLNPISNMIALYRFYKQLKSLSPDIILSYFVTPIVFGTLAAKLAGIHYKVAMIEGLGYAFTQRPDKKNIKSILIKYTQIFLYKLILPLANSIIVLNPDDLDELKNKYHIKLPQTIVLGGIGVPDHFFQDSIPPTAPITFTFIGRLLNDKGIREYIEAAQLTHARHKEVHFHIVGDVDPLNPSSLSPSIIEKLNHSCNIKFIGHTNNIIQEINHSSVVVLPSYREGFPRVIQEAMALGRPIITTDVPGCRQTISDQTEGFLVPPFSAEAVAERMEFFIQNPDKIIAMGKNAHLTAMQKYNSHGVTSKLVNILLSYSINLP